MDYLIYEHYYINYSRTSDIRTSDNLMNGEGTSWWVRHSQPDFFFIFLYLIYLYIYFVELQWSYYQKKLNILSWSFSGVWLRKVHNFRHTERREEIEKFSAESADPSGLEKWCIVRRDNDKDFIVQCILVDSENKNSRVYH